MPNARAEGKQDAALASRRGQQQAVQAQACAVRLGRGW